MMPITTKGATMKKVMPTAALPTIDRPLQTKRLKSRISNNSKHFWLWICILLLHASRSYSHSTPAWQERIVHSTRSSSLHPSLPPLQ